MRASRLAIGLLALGVLSCGGDRNPVRPTAPPTPPPSGLAAGTVLSIVAGDSGAPVANATVVVDGVSYVADGSGQIAVSATARPGALVDVVSTGTLDRQTTVQTRQPASLTLWPRTTASGIDEAFTAALVYTSAALGGGAPGAERLIRLPAGTTAVIVVPSAELLADDSAHRFHTEAVARMSAATRGAVVYALGRERPAAGIVFDASLRPSEALCAERVRGFTRLTIRGDEIQGGEIVYCSWDGARSLTVEHELGHSFGLRHSNDPRDVMGTSIASRREEFSAREADIMQLMMQRRAGNRFPDSDRGVAGTSTGEDLIVCR